MSRPSPSAETVCVKGTQTAPASTREHVTHHTECSADSRNGPSAMHCHSNPTTALKRRVVERSLPASDPSQPTRRRFSYSRVVVHRLSFRAGHEIPDDCAILVVTRANGPLWSPFSSSSFSDSCGDAGDAFFREPFGTARHALSVIDVPVVRLKVPKSFAVPESTPQATLSRICRVRTRILARPHLHRGRLPAYEPSNPDTNGQSGRATNSSRRPQEDRKKQRARRGRSQRLKEASVSNCLSTNLPRIRPTTEGMAHLVYGRRSSRFLTCRTGIRRNSDSLRVGAR
jgi:hypothetical protein